MLNNKNSFRAAVAAAGVCVVGTLMSAPAGAQIIADSVADFSSTQGQNNWTYGFYSGSGTLGPTNFATFPNFAGTAPTGQWERTPSAYQSAGLGFFTALNAAGGHPHAIAGGVAEVNHAVRRWTSPIAGTIVIAGNFNKTSDFFNGVQDGAIFRVYVDNSEMFSMDVPATTTAQMPFAVSACVSVGSTVDLVVDPKTNEFSDGFNLAATIRTNGPRVIDGPLPSLTCPSGITAFGVDVIGGIGTSPLNFVWQIQTAPNTWQDLGTNLVELPCPNGSGGTPGVASAGQADTATLLVRVRPCTGGTVNPGLPTTYQLRCIVTDGCETSTSPEATLTICPADFNCSSAVTVQDIFDFLSAWFSGDVAGNFNLVGGVTVQDIFDFLTAWFAGCAIG